MGSPRIRTTPWECFGGDKCPYCPLCRKLHARWFAIRYDLEQRSEWKPFAGSYTGKFNAGGYMGYCKNGGKKGYIKLPLDARLAALSPTLSDAGGA